MHQVAEFIRQRSPRVVVICGAGISTSCGIADFRSEGTGLYHNLQKYGLTHPEAVFDLNFFVENPGPFYDVVRSIWVYTQNIDGLEKAAGVPADRVVEMHGNFDSCSVLGRPDLEVPVDELKAALDNDEGGWQAIAERHKGLVKPSIVLFGERLPKRFHELYKQDLAACDLLIVLGTSLKVNPCASMTTKVRRDSMRLLINRDAVRFPFKLGLPRSGKGIFQRSDCDDAVLNLCRLLGWEADVSSCDVFRI
mmetsp:Transcript_13796/g.37400  ORF Transcript_13796/g.37400 Transcript_13796/m.37400 type:complete len:251 (-) Transcript_13796:106-858(-)